MVKKKYIFLSICLIILFVVAMLYANRIFFPRASSEIQYKTSQPVIVSLYDGELHSKEKDRISIKLRESGAIGGFLVNEKTVVVHSQTRGADVREETKDLSDIPIGAKISIQVIDSTEERSYTAVKITY